MAKKPNLDQTKKLMARLLALPHKPHAPKKAAKKKPAKKAG